MTFLPSTKRVPSNSSDANKLVKIFAEDEDLRILNGRWGPYIAKGKDNYRIPKGQKADDLSFEAVMAIIQAESKNVKSTPAKTPAKKVAAKKTAAKKTAAKKTAAKKSTK
jgi:DNA topoisomerase-1